MEKIAEQRAADIKNRRQRIGVSQEALAKEAEISYRTVLRFEKGGYIRDEKLKKIISGLGRLEKSGQKLGPWWLSHKEVLGVDLGGQGE